MLFFERMKTQRGEWPKTFEKDRFPQEARAQCWQILQDRNIDYRVVVTRLRHALGVYQLNTAGKSRGYMDTHSYSNELNHFLHNGQEGGESLHDVEYALTVLELMILDCSEYNGRDEAIEHINYRLRLAGVGFMFSSINLVPVDDEDLTNDAVIPTISLLNQDFFASSYGYLRQAFLDYKSGSSESLQSAIDNTVKAVESTLKTIFEDLEIEYGPKDTYMPLVQKAAEEGLFPMISSDKLAPLTNELKALGEIRNQQGGHGGPAKDISAKAVRLAIHHATANLLYIVETYLERKN